MESRPRSVARASDNLVVQLRTMSLAAVGRKNDLKGHCSKVELCGKDATKWLVCEEPMRKVVDKCPKTGHKCLISL